MSSYVRGDVTLLRTVDQLIFQNYIAHKKQRLLLVVCLFLNDTSFKTLKGGKIYKKIFQNFCFSCYIRKIISEKLITCSRLFFLLVRGKQLIHVRNFVHINILIGVHCSKSLGFSFKIRGWHFGVVTLQDSQRKTALQDYKLKIFHILLCHLKELYDLIKNNIKAMSKNKDA